MPRPSHSPENSDAKLLSASEFVLSDAAVKAGIDGTLRIAVTVDETGAAKNVRIVSGPAWPCGSKPKKELDEVRETVKLTVLTARFSPALKKGKPISADVALSFAIGDAYRRKVEQKEAEEAVRTGAVAAKLFKGGVLNGKALRLVKPAYPSFARSERASGSVIVEVLIDENGNVIRAGAIQGHPVFYASARDAACDSKFSPIFLEGKPIKVSGVITYNFVP